MAGFWIVAFNDGTSSTSVLRCDFSADNLQLFWSLISPPWNNLLSNSKPNQIYLNKISLSNSSTNKEDINKYFLTIIIFIISLFTITLLLTISNIDLENSFKIGILTIMNTVNSSMYGVKEFDFYDLSVFAKYTLIVFMIIGRIELLTIFILFKKFLFKN